jgi:hypothetical protein
VIHRDLHVEVQPGHGVRPVLSFQKDGIGSTHLYAIRIELVADPGGRVLDAGQFVIAVPGPVSRTGQVLPESDETFLNPAAVTGETLSTWCFRHNLAAMRDVIAESGRRSDYVAALAHVRLAKTWNSYADRRPLRATIAELFRTDAPEAAIYAVEAAARDDDPRYALMVRKRAVSVLLRRLREEVDDDPSAAIEDAERVLFLGPSAAAKRLLWQAKARQHADEEESEEEP